MDETARLDDMRRDVLKKIATSERDFKLLIVLAAAVEGGGLLAFLCMMDFGERLHWLLLVMAFLIYGTLAVGLFALGSYTRTWILRVLKAVDLLHDQQTR